jgi:hypothetical protein
VVTRLAIRRFVTAAPRGAEQRIARLARAVTRDGLTAALATADIPAGIWCVRRLDVRVGLNLEDDDAVVGGAWADAVVAGLLGALAGGDPDVVHYTGSEQALVDLIASAAVGRVERAWAWNRAGVRDEGDPDPGSAPGAAIVTAVQRHDRQAPDRCLPVLLAAMRRVGLPALHRVLGGAGPRAPAGGWAAVAALQTPADVLDAVGPSERPDTASAAPRDRLPDGGAGPQRRLARELFDRSAFAAAVAKARLRPDEVDAQAWAALVTAESDRSAFGRPDAVDVLRALTALLAGRTHRPMARGSAATPPGDATPIGDHAPSGAAVPTTESQHGDDGAAAPGDAAPANAAPDGGHPYTSAPVTAVPTEARDADRMGDDPDAASRSGTRWAGLTFLLALTPAVGVPHNVLADPDLAARSLPWVLQAVALTLLPLAGDDPALAAFAGLDPAEPSAWDAGPAATAVERAAVDRLAKRWSAATARALDRPPAEAAATVRAVAARHGTVAYSPGWIEVELALDEVDVDVRMAGLDLDPGWVPWLGCVVRYRYA